MNSIVKHTITGQLSSLELYIIMHMDKYTKGGTLTNYIHYRKAHIIGGVHLVYTK